MAEVKRLIAEGAPVDWQNESGWAPLHGASNHGHTEIVMLLIEHKCNINAIEEDAFTPLMYAARKNHFEIVHRLVAAGADTSMRSHENKTAAEIARGCGHENIAEYLATLRFRASCRDESGRLHHEEGRAVRAVDRDLRATGMLPDGPLALIKEFAIG